MKYFLAFLLIPVFLSAQKKNEKEIAFTFNEFRNLVNFFETKKDLLDFFDLKKGDHVADIGAGEGKYEGAFSLLCDSVTFYSQEIDEKLLNKDKLNKVIKHYSKIKGTPQTNTFNFCIGTEKSSNLPDSTFDKIIMISSFHEFTFMDE
ncbi:MAG: hypothetical protein IAF38_18905, partial [Bacteroidia bacterium]|nr:hypothetical protein [Bacteroidia bacterium]